MVYLDYNATTPLDPEVVSAITNALTEAWGNPSSAYKEGKAAKTLITQARKNVAMMIGAAPSDIIFTSGGTEGNNWILRSMLDESHHKCQGDGPVKDKSKPHFITSNVEHDSIHLVLKHFLQMGWADVTYVPVSLTSGSVDPEDVVAAIRPNTVMITIMMANNETGVIQPISEISKKVKMLKRKSGQKIYIHSDAAQAIGKIPVNVTELGVDYLTIVGHKFYGPRIGAVFVSNLEAGTPLPALLFGGGQERNFRPGTENTPMIAGLGKAAELVCNNVDLYNQKMRETRDFLEESLKETFGNEIVFNGKFPVSQRLPNTCNVSFLGTNLKGHEILSKAPSVQASVGAACHSQERPSHILLALNIPASIAWKALRISVGRETTKEDIKEAVEALRLVI